MPVEAHGCGVASGRWLVGYALPGGKLGAARGKAALSFYDFDRIKGVEKRAKGTDHAFFLQLPSTQ